MELIDDGIEEWYTVVGFWFETLERWTGHFLADTALGAEEMAQQHARSRMLHLGVVGVFKGELKVQDSYATWIDPYCTSQEQMDTVMDEGGFWSVGRHRLEIAEADKRKEAKGWWKK